MARELDLLLSAILASTGAIAQDDRARILKALGELSRVSAPEPR